MLTKDEIVKLLEGRQVIDTYRKEHTDVKEPSSEKLQEDIKALGFDSIDAFFKYNSECIKTDASKAVTFIGECDKCEGRKRGCIDSCWQIRMDSGVKLLIPDIANVSIHLRVIGGYGHKLCTDGLTKDLPLMPNCSIKVHFNKQPEFDWFWGQ